jgi:hypothetical protein
MRVLTFDEIAFVAGAGSGDDTAEPIVEGERTWGTVKSTNPLVATNSAGTYKIDPKISSSSIGIGIEMKGLDLEALISKLPDAIAQIGGQLVDYITEAFGSIQRMVESIYNFFFG